ncbi:chemotaxis protein [Campylobacter pinnipediorum subsp. pinnipediorum]|uniref:cache domain-containing protein n=1 Tax=Campylobacter pinnipediorum TaxID=1965231 RepID=UPI000994DDB3|nr:cache domain-containing protein [Campylobacter pinnipediorum]OPA76476.1 chemotaxis protein [Campylobacter pinnipediorum subsp. pinnipediorum]
MIKNSIFIKILVLFFVVIFISVIFFYNSYIKERELNSAKIFFDYQIKQLHKNVEDQKLSSLALSVILSQNNKIQECFLDLNRSLCISNMNDIISNLSSVLMYKNIKIHLHTKDLKSYLRSWSPNNFGDNLSSFRNLLLEANKNKKSVAGVEIGIGGVFTRAVSNIIKQKQKLGTIEIMLDFEHISNFFKDQGIDLFVLVDKDKMIIDSDYRTNELLKDYYIANLNSANLNVVEILKDIDLTKKTFFIYKTHYFALSPMLDAGGKRIGFFVLHINKNIKEQNILQDYMLLNSLF